MKFAFIYGTFLLLQISNSEIFTAVTKLKSLINTQRAVVFTLEKYIQELERNLKSLKMNVQEFKIEQVKSSQNTEEYLGGPLNVFLLIKRLTLDWTEIQNLMMSDKLREMIKNLRNNSDELVIFPTEDDFTGAAKSIIRLQDFYKLTPASIAKGELNGHRYSNQLSAIDCYYIGSAAYDEKDYFNAVLWMIEAKRLWHSEINKTIDLSIVLKLLTSAYYNEKNLEKKIKLVEELLKGNPNDEILLNEKKKYEQELKNKKDGTKNQTLSFQESNEQDDPGFHKKLCRNEVKLEESVKAKLNCRYMDFNNSFLKLAKFKVEEVSLEPKILLYHDVISDREIETLKNLSAPTLARAKIYYPSSNKTEYNANRIGQVSWLADDIHPLIKILNQRVEDMTGLSTQIAENLQVVNYGIGGFFYLHYDAVRRGNESVEGVQQINRLATVLFYMSDVAQGGATVFPSAKAAIQPRKGTAAFWVNLLPDGATNLKTSHAACPILLGSKWISTKWLQIKGQKAQCPVQSEGV